ncbi:MAG: hypothetical protein QW814_00255 [Methanothrix sp.]
MQANKSKKLQSSIEFIVILAAVSGMAVIGISYYSNIRSVFTNAIASANQSSIHLGSANSPNTGNDIISAYIFAPTLELGKISQATLFVSTSMASNIIINTSGSGVRINPAGLANKTGSFGSAYLFYLTPFSTGMDNITMRITAENDSKIYYKKISFELPAYEPYTYDKKSNSSSTISSIYLKPKSEYILYYPGNPENLYNITESSHCSYLNFMGDQMPIQSQCGNASWYFWSFSANCYYGSAQVLTKTYCIYKHYSGYNASSISTNASYLYNISLGLGYDGLNLSANTNQSVIQAKLFSGNSTYGNVTIGNSIYAESPINGLYLIRSKSGNYIASDSNYTALEYAYSNIENDLAYYNNSDNGNVGTINREIYSFNNVLSQTLKSLENANSNQCSVTKTANLVEYKCSPEAPFDFNNISIKIKNYSGLSYETDYEGSQISVSK